MYKVNVAKVKGKIAEKGYTITSLAERLNIDRNTLAKYLVNPGKIPYDVLSAMAALLCDTEDEARLIFFAQELTRYVR